MLVKHAVFFIRCFCKATKKPLFAYFFGIQTGPVDGTKFCALQTKHEWTLIQNLARRLACFGWTLCDRPEKLSEGMAISFHDPLGGILPKHSR